VPLIVFVPVIFYLMYLGAQSLSLLNILLAVIVGLLVWTTVEYIMHRFVFHYHPSSKIGKRLHFILHGVHHDYPQDRMRLVLPPIMSIPLATFFYFLFGIFTDSVIYYPFFAGFLLGYLCYDMLHYAIHHATFKGKLWNVLKTHHLKHHYVDDTKGFGVSSPIWDVLVQSDFPKKKFTNKKTSTS